MGLQLLRGIRRALIHIRPLHGQNEKLHYSPPKMLTRVHYIWGDIQLLEEGSCYSSWMGSWAVSASLHPH